MADEFIVVAQAFLIQDALAVTGDHHRIIERTAPAQAGGAHRFDFLLEAESTGAADLGLEGGGIDGQRNLLTADRGSGEIDIHRQREVFGRRQGRDLVAIGDGDAL